MYVPFGGVFRVQISITKNHTLHKGYENSEKSVFVRSFARAYMV